MSETYFLFVGSLNRPAPYFAAANGTGLTVFRFDAETLEAKRLAEAQDIENPTFFSVSADGSAVYANSEVFGWKEGLVSAFSFDKATHALDYINMQPALGSITAQNLITRDRRHLLVVNYSMGDGGPDQSLVIYPFTDKMGLEPPIASVRQVGAGPNHERQERSHAHSIIEIGDNVFVVADLGCDTLTSYRLTEDSKLLRLYETRCAPGAGPRHMALHPRGHFLFVLNELNSTCASFSVDRESGRLSPINVVQAVPDADLGGNHCADIQISADGRFLYGSNRGHDSIAVFSVSPDTGELAPAGIFPCGGKTPRNLAISPSGRHVFCANQDSDRITIFERDAVTGGLRDTGRCIETGTPMCIKIAEA
ncbi:lactonase family protein [Rhizobium sp. BK251]|uniref:lactonase family protein n=1 Tax=Rhizobium sp. BK251 TaxID=2512125 RepID=UPI001045DD8B|nr:lactonase family protein [Rhizobium sp. BK251]TCL71452.1 6-phosphogluconolactonase [Rhizobium sp. BK251]